MSVRLFENVSAVVVALGTCALSTPVRAQTSVDLGPVPQVTISCFNQSPNARQLSPDAGRDGSWLQFRRDRHLTGRSPLIGTITCPRVEWTADLGARKTWFSVVPGSGGQERPIPTSGTLGNSFGTRIDYETEGFRIDLDGNGNHRIDPSDRGNHKVGDFLSELPGYERVSCDSGQFRPGTIGNDVPLTCYLQNRQGGQWNLVWESQPLPGFTNNTSVNGQLLVGDFDLDGQTEVAALGWYEVYLLNLRTGALEQRGEFHSRTAGGTTSGRAYGWFGAFDVADGPEREFVIMGDFEKFISVIGWREGRLVELWDYQIEAGITQSYAKHHPSVQPVADIDGDGRPEIVTSMFHYSHAGQWHVLAFDGATGAVKLTLANHYLSGLGDINDDGVAEMLLTATSGPVVPEYTGASVASYKGGALSVLWSSAQAGFSLVNTDRFADHVNSRTTYYQRTAFLRRDWTSGPPVFATQEHSTPDPNVTVRLFQWNGSGIGEIGSAVGPRLKVVSLPVTQPSRGILIQTITQTTAEGPLRLANLAATQRFSGRAEFGDGHPAAWTTLLTSTVVGRLTAGGRPTVVTQDFLQNVRALEIVDNRPQELWRAPGRGWVSGLADRSVASINAFGSLLLADTTNTGDLGVVVASETSDGYGAVRVLDERGSTQWETRFNVPGTPPIWNEGGITNWMAGRMTPGGQEDVLVSTRRTMMHSDELTLVSGRTGQPVWRRTDGGQYSGCAPPHRTGAGGIVMSMLDFNGDGFLDPLNLFSSLFAVYSGVSGAMLLNRWTFESCPSPAQIFKPGFLAHAHGVFADFVGDGTQQVLYAKNDAVMALLRLDGTLIWETPHFDGMPSPALQGIGDFDGDGFLDILVAGHCGAAGHEIRRYNGRSGAVVWSAPLARACEWPRPKTVVTGDLDGDGRDEALIMNGNILHAFGENAQGQGVELWRATWASGGWNEFGDPVIADIDGTGRPQILINTPSGHLFALGQHLGDAPICCASVQPPTHLAAWSIVGNQVTLRWRVPALGPAPTGYVLEGGLGPGQVLASIHTGSEFPVYSLAVPTGAFYVRIYAMFGAARSAASNEIRIFVNTPAPPSGPYGLVGVASGSSLGLAWRNTFTGGPIESLILDVSGTFTTSFRLGVTESFTFAGVPNGTYTLSVRAENGSGTSTSSNPVTLTFPAVCPGPPAPPVDFLVSRAGAAIRAIWQPAATGPAGTEYQLHVSGALSATLSTTARSVGGVVGPGAYSLSVQATNMCGTSPATPVQTIIVP